MCRYAMIAYKPHLACFDCRKTFKRRLMWDIQRGADDQKAAKCPECGQPMADMGKDFESPKKTAIKEWQHLKNLYTVGITFHSCGCTGPGYIPAGKEDAIAYFNECKADYYKQLEFWRNRIQPSSPQEIDREQNKHQQYTHKVPSYSKSKTITNQEAIDYWIGKIKEVEGKLAFFNQT